MYQMLIVDDEVLVIEGLKVDLDLQKLNVSRLFTANNIRQAKEVIKENKIDLILCDIEMPQGTGLDLLNWIRENNYDTQCIFLTSHAKFNYAQQAIQLGSVDYLLKPVLVDELEEVIYKAIDEINRSNEMEQVSHYKELWTRNHPLIIERFWIDLISQTIPSNITTIKKIAIDRNINLSEELRFLPILIGFQRWNKEWSLREQKQMEYALKNSAEKFIMGNSYGEYVQLSQNLSLMILTLDKDQEMEQDVLVKNCELYIDSCNQLLHCDLSCYIGNATLVEDMYKEVNRLKLLEINNVVFDNKVFYMKQEANLKSQMKMPDMTAWIAMLKKGTNEQVVKEVKQFLEEVEGMDANYLRQFHQNFLQMIFFVLNLKGIQAHQLFCDTRSVELSEKATHSIKEMVIWINHVMTKAAVQTEVVEETNTVVDSVKNYIALHIDNSDLSREEIAKHVFLNQDYLSRLFKKETGVALSDYIMQERIQLARELLQKTNMAISEVASSVGYSNFSHFSKVFRKCIGLNPKDFRQSV
jgi:two-component system response regulator YesN